MPDYSEMLVSHAEMCRDINRIPMRTKKTGIDRALAVNARRTEPVFVSRDVGAMMDDAADLVPLDWTFMESDVFTPHGYIWLEQPKRQLIGPSFQGVLNGFMWSVHPPTGELDVAPIMWMPEDDGALGILSALPLEFGSQPLKMTADAINGSHLDPEGSVLPYFNLVIRQIASLLTFANQRITSTTRIRPDRGSARRAQRQGAIIRDIQTITLRRYHQAVADVSRGRTVEWRKRWIVTGHWRKQWFPSLQMHRLIWIAPYVKGPDGKPLDNPQKIFALTR